ncbi:MAG: response regulator [Anaerolineae bacterium]|nr:response regulator [Anaerolineae bacterium]
MFMATRFSILCIDDNEEVLRILQAILLRAGHQVHTAAGGRYAIDVLRQLTTLDVIMVNFRMEGMSGMDVIKFVAEEPRLDGAGVVINSPGSVLDLPVHHAAWSRVDVCLPQPFQPMELYDAVFEAYTRRRGYLYQLAI